MRALVLALGLVAGLTGCKDRFECGVVGPEGVATRCDQVGERCVCGVNRCARAAADCASGLRFSFGDEGCVSAALRPTAIDGANQAYCPGEGEPAPSCGQPGDPACGPGQTCHCAENRCVVRDNQCAADWRYANGEGCLVTSPDELLPSEAEDAPLCARYREPTCGAATDAPCADDGLCLCALRRCVTRDAACAGAGLRYAADDTCAEPTESVSADDLLRDLAPAGELCARFLPTACGRPGGPTCGAGEFCLCSTQRCLLPDRACAADWALAARPDVCLEAAEVAGAEIVGADAVCSRFEAPVDPACGAPGDATCGDGQVCLCGPATCGLVDNACASGFAGPNTGCVEGPGEVLGPDDPALCARFRDDGARP